MMTLSSVVIVGNPRAGVDRARGGVELRVLTEEGVFIIWMVELLQLCTGEAKGRHRRTVLSANRAKKDCHRTQG